MSAQVQKFEIFEKKLSLGVRSSWFLSVCHMSINQFNMTGLSETRGQGAMTAPDFDRSVDLSQQGKGGGGCSSHYYLPPPGFSDPPTALHELLM
jgi:hypothetical protein